MSANSLPAVNENYTVKKTYSAGQYLRQTVTFLIMVGATGEPPIYIERRGHARLKKIIEKTRAHIPANKSRFSFMPAIRAGKYFIDMDLDGLSKDVDEFRTVMSDMIDIIDSVEDAAPSDEVPRMERIQSVRNQIERGKQLELPAPKGTMKAVRVTRDFEEKMDREREARRAKELEPIRFVIKDA